MAITTTVGTPTYCPVSTTTDIIFDAGAAPKALVVTTATGGTRYNPTSVTWNGTPLTLRSEGSFATLGDMNSSVWVLENPDSGSHTLAVECGLYEHAITTPYALTSGGLVSFADEYHVDTGLTYYRTTTLDSGSDQSVIIMAYTSNGGGGVGTPAAGFTEDHETALGGDVVASGHEDPSVAGSRTVGWPAGNAYTTIASVLMVAGEPIVAPTIFGAEVGFTAGAAIGLTGSQYILGARIRPLEVGFQTGLRMGGTTKRQVALVGPDDAPRLFTPEMTEGGNEGDILTQHADSPPTWEAKTHYEPVRFDTDGDGVADDWLFHTDGDVVMLEVEN